MFQLGELLSVEVYAAHGLMELLWHYAGDYAAQGDIGKVSDGRIASGVHWRGDPHILIGAMVDSRLIDECGEYRLVIHDWPDHAQDWVRKKLRRSNLDWLPIYGKSLYASDDTSSHSRDKVGTKSGQSRDTSSHEGHKNLSSHSRDTVRTNSPTSRKGREGELRGGNSTSGTQKLTLPASQSKSINGQNGNSEPFDVWFDRQWLRHPRKLAKHLAEQRALEAYNQGKFSLVEFEKVHTAWSKCSDWQKENFRWCPSLDKWINDEGFRTMPSEMDLANLPGHMNPGLIDN